jgi:hypothetical protein
MVFRDLMHGEVKIIRKNMPQPFGIGVIFTGKRKSYSC